MRCQRQTKIILFIFWYVTYGKMVVRSGCWGCITVTEICLFLYSISLWNIYPIISATFWCSKSIKTTDKCLYKTIPQSSYEKICWHVLWLSSKRDVLNSSILSSETKLLLAGQKLFLSINWTSWQWRAQIIYKYKFFFLWEPDKVK